MSTTPHYLVAGSFGGVTLVNITPATMDAAGNLTLYGTTYSVTGTVRRISSDQTTTLDEASPMTSQWSYPVPIAYDEVVVIDQYLRLNDSAGNPTNLLAHVAYGWDHVKVSWKRAGITITGWYVIESYDETYDGGVMVGSLTLRQISARDGSNLRSQA